MSGEGCTLESADKKENTGVTEELAQSAMSGLQATMSNPSEREQSHRIENNPSETSRKLPALYKERTNKHGGSTPNVLSLFFFSPKY